jgi:hypothetical protein
MSYPDDTSDIDATEVDAIETRPDEDDSSNTGLVDPGIDRHDFATEWESLWEEAHDDPRETLPALEDLVRRLMLRHGYAVAEDDPLAGGEEREILATYWAAREIAEALRAGREVEAGDAAQAINDLREIYESLIDRVEGRSR